MAVDDHARRKSPLNVIESRVQIAGESECVGARLLLNAEYDRWRAFVRTAPSLQSLSSPHLSDIPYQNRMGIASFHDNVSDVVLVRSAPETLDDVLLSACHTKPGRRVVVRTA